MSFIQLQPIDHEQLHKAMALLDGVPHGIGNALKGASQQATRFLRQNSAKAIQEKYAISTANIRANENVIVRYTYHDGVQAFVAFSGNKIPLYRYNGTSPASPTPLKDHWIKVTDDSGSHWYHPGAPAYAHQYRDTAPALFENAFVARMKSGHVGIFERSGGKSRGGGDAITEIMGSSVSTMLGNEQVSDKLGEQTSEKFREAFDNEIVRLLNGWGG